MVPSEQNVNTYGLNLSRIGNVANEMTIWQNCASCFLPKSVNYEKCAVKDGNIENPSCKLIKKKLTGLEYKHN